MKHNTPTCASLSTDPRLSAEDDLLIYHLFGKIPLCCRIILALRKQNNMMIRKVNELDLHNCDTVIFRGSSSPSVHIYFPNK